MWWAMRYQSQFACVLECVLIPFFLRDFTRYILPGFVKVTTSIACHLAAEDVVLAFKDVSMLR